jgi:hypothetical protein
MGFPSPHKVALTTREIPLRALHTKLYIINIGFPSFYQNGEIKELLNKV